MIFWLEKYIVVVTLTFNILLTAATALFALEAGTFKCQGIILVEVMERFPQYSPSSILWIFTLTFILGGTIGKLSEVDI